MEWALWGESASLSEGTRVELLELGRLNAVLLNWLEGLGMLVSEDAVQVIGCSTVRVPGWDMVHNERQVFWGGSFTEDR